MKGRLLIYLLFLLPYAGFSQSCSLSVTLSQSAPAICSGNVVFLSATTSGGTAPFTYVWSTGETTASINIDKAGTYSVSVSDNTPGCQPVSQSITIAVSVTPVAPTLVGATVCANSSATLTALAPGGNYQWYDSATGGKFLASGASYTTPPITANTIFYVETTVAGCTSTRTAVPVALRSSPIVKNASICAGNVATLSVSSGDSYVWYDAPAGGKLVGTAQNFTTPVLNSTTTYYVAVAANGCTSALTPVTAFVTPFPAAPVASNVSVCAGSSANLHATAGAGIFNWYNASTGGAPLISSPDYTTPPLTATTTYYVENSINGCESSRTPVTVTVNPIPQDPAAQTDTICYGTTALLTAVAPPSGTYQWYDAATGGNLLTTGLSYKTPALNNSTTYYLQVNNGGCISARSAVNVIIEKQIPAPTVSGSIICSGSATTIAATGPGGTYAWYDAPTGGNLLTTGASFTTPLLNANATYYVQTTVSGCVSPRVPVTVSVLPAIASPAASNTTVCTGNTAALTATGSPGNYAWYDSAAGGNLLSVAQVFVTPALSATTTYYVESTANGCTSQRTPVTVTVTPFPATPIVSGVSVCPGTSATLTATAASGTIQWYDAPAGGNLLQTGNTYNTPALSANTTYYVQGTNGTCNSPRVPVTVTVITITGPQFQYAFGTFCTSGPNPSPVINNPSGGIFSASPGGLVFVNNTTGQINISASTPGNYVVSFASNGPCPATTSADIAIDSTANATFSYPGPYCQDGVNPFPKFPLGSSAGNFSALPAGLVFVNTSTGEIDLGKSIAGTYTVKNTINASGGCPPDSATSNVTIDQMAIVSAGPPQTVPAGNPVQLAGRISGGANTGTWTTAGTGTFLNPNLPNAIYTPGAGETSATLTLTSIGPPSPCGPQSDKVTITINAIPGTPTAAGASVCSGNSATLSATAPVGTYQWYDAATGGNLMATGPDFTTPPLTGNTTYYVQTTVNGINSARSAVTVTVNPPPAQPIATGQQICMGSSTTLTASGSTGTYQWYDAAAGGNLLSVNSAYTTPVLTTNTTYYVQAALNGCTSARTLVNVTVTGTPHITSPANGSICSSNPLNYTITTDVPGATFSWSRAQVAGISNPMVTNQTSSAISETLINTTTNPINVTYVIITAAGSCQGPSFNYVLTVYPTPVVTSAAKVTVCDSSAVNYAITFNTAATNFSWSRAAVPGISNAAVSGQTAGVIKEVLFNTTNAAVAVTYLINYNKSTCAGPPFNLTVTVNPTAVITSAAAGIACTGSPQGYVIKSNVASATFNWGRIAVANISNPAVSGQTSGTINETLINTSPGIVGVVYKITPIVNGCPGTPFNYNVAVNPPMAVPVANSSSPVCVGSTLHLQTDPVGNGSYLWTGPNGFTSTLQNPDIANVSVANAGTYSLVVTVNGCSSLPVTTQAIVDELPVANAGPDQVVCVTAPSLTLAGSVTGGTTTGIWTTAGTGTFSPASNMLNGQYLPSPADKAAGSVVLTLTSTSKDNCNVSTSNMTVTFGPKPAVNAGPSQEVCPQFPIVKLNGTKTIPGNILWSTSGTGTFSPSDTQLAANYNASPADIKNGGVTLKLHIFGTDVCYIPTDSMTIKFVPPPTVNAGGIRYVLKGRTITLYPAVNENNVHYLWAPDIDINNDTLKNPVITGDINRTYTLTVTDNRGCVTQDTTLIIVSPPINIDNTFTPNGDGINDYWDIKGLIAYTEATVDIFNRWGQHVFHSLGYPRAWDGTYNGKKLPAGVYYYVINTNFNGQVVSGWVTVLR